MMSFSWKQYEGQVINNTFPLLKYLGGSSESAVFLTQLAGPQSSKAVLKLVPEGASVDLQLSLWRRASKLTHPNLLQLYQGGRCRLADMDLLYVIMEYAEENLSEILPQRALTPAEARDMLGPVLDALSHLHAQGLVHSHLKPTNILATSDQVKLSTDRLFPAGEIRKSTAKRTVYDPPESANQSLTAASDVWSLGVMLIEVMTQHAPTGQPGSPSAESLAQPFRDIAHHALERDPQLRWSLAQIAASLKPRAAAAAQSVSPLAVPLSTVPAVPAAKLQVPQPAPFPPPPAPRQPLFTPRGAKASVPAPPSPPGPVMPPIVPPLAKAPSSAPPVIPPLTKTALPAPLKVGGAKRDIVLPSYVIPLAAGLLIVAAVIALPKFLSRGVESSPPVSRTAASRPAAPGPEAPRARTEVSSSSKPGSAAAARDSLKTPATKPTEKEISQPPAASSAAPSPAPASLHTETKPAADAASSSAARSGNAPGHGEVLDQILPDVPDKALATITGRVRVVLRAHVDAAGNVASAEFENPGPSEYFANAALKAVRRWEFTSAETNGRSVPSEWLVRFEFSSDGVKAFPKQITP
jgi:TonB family protein